MKASGYQKSLDPDSVSETYNLRKDKSGGHKMQIIIIHSPLEYCVNLMK